MSSLSVILPYLYDPDVLMHILIVLLSLIVFAISVLAFSKKRNTRYLLLSIAFFFLTVSQSVTLIETLFFSGALLMIPLVDIHITHLFDFLMLLNFGLALARNWDGVRRGLPRIE